MPGQRPAMAGRIIYELARDMQLSEHYGALAWRRGTAALPGGFGSPVQGHGGHRQVESAGSGASLQL
jgi:hypothetical protein